MGVFNPVQSIKIRGQQVGQAKIQARQAKAMLLRKIPLSESSLENIARDLRSRSALNLPLDEPTLAAQPYLAMTAEQGKGSFLKGVPPEAWYW
jgi:zinc protease